MCRKFNSFDPVDSPAYANAQTIELRTARDERTEERSLCPAISSSQGVTRLTSRPLSTWAVAFRVLINKRHIALWLQSSRAVEGVRCAKTLALHADGTSTNRNSYMDT